MALARGTKVGGYEVAALLGCGGMGEVYRAHDARLHRDVALKVLPDSFAADPDRRARFEREAQVLASLNHPYIAAIYGVDDSGPVKALVLELVEGPTLADRIARGPLPLDEARAIGLQIAAALEAAHEHGIVHRDLKPANVKVREDGTVKVLDFGLAKAVDTRDGGSTIAESTTITAPVATRAGVLLGTAVYMSPEVARGQAADRRCDIWAFGCVLYEMLAGRPAFAGENVADVLGAILHLEPDWDALPSPLPPALMWALRRCLQKDPKARMHDIADVSALIAEAAAPIPDRLPARNGTAYAGWLVAGVVTVAAVLAIAWRVTPTPADSPETRLQITTPPTDDPFSFAVSPDGRSVIYQARDGDRSLLWLRRLESEEPQALAGTERGTNPFWSSDSQSAGFFADGLLKRIDVSNGFVRTVTAAPNSRTGAWGPDGTILFSASVGPLFKVSADGGPAVPATVLLPGQTNHRLPQFLPDGRRFLLYVLGATTERGMYVGSLADSHVNRVCDRDSGFAWLPPSTILVARAGALLARRFDPARAAAEGELLPVAPQVLVHSTRTGYAAVSASATGTIAYRASESTRQLAWIDRGGQPTSVLGRADAAQLVLWSLAPDGHSAAVERKVDGNSDVWILAPDRGSRRVTVDPAEDGTPVFSPDGRRLVYVSDAKADVWDIFVRSSDGMGTDTLLLESPQNKLVYDWSPDGRHILYGVQDEQNDYDLWALSIEAPRRPAIPIARTRFVESEGRFSPDGRWVAFNANDTGTPEVYVQPFPGPGPRVQVSVGGGSFPRWRRDGRELFYVAPDNRLTAVSIACREGTVDVGQPHALFTIRDGVIRSYEVAPDGQRFLINTVLSPASPITVIMNWKPPFRH